MGIFNLFLLSFGLAMDATAIAIANGINYPNLKFRKRIAIAFCFAFFQGIMPIFGYYFSKKFLTFIDKIDNFLIFLIFLILSIKMFFSFLKKDSDILYSLSNKDILTQGISSSIDALLVGSIFIVYKFYIYKASLVIFFVTFCLCFLGITLSCKIGKMFGESLKLVGAIILFIIALKALFK